MSRCSLFSLPVPAGAPQSGPPGRHLGHYPSLPPGYNNTPASQGAAPPMHPPMQTAPSQYPPQPQLYQQVTGASRQDVVVMSQ